VDRAALSKEQIVAYSLPAAAMAILMLAVGVYLPNFYTDELGLSAGMLAWVLLAGRLWDAVTDPAMGFVSDRSRSRWGRRRPFMAAAALPIWGLFYLLWSPAPALGERGLFLHLLACYLALYTFTTVFWIPYISLGMELTPSYHERTRLFGARQAFYLLGTALGMLTPPLFAKAAGSVAAGYSQMALAFGGLSSALLLVSFARVRERATEGAPSPFPFFEGLRITFRNRAFVILMLTYLVALVGGSFIAPLTLYVAKYVIRAEWAVPLVMIAYLVGSIASVALWVRLSRRIGKNRTWSAGMVLATAVYATSFVYREGTWELWIALAMLIGAANGCTMTLGASISADVIDSDELETGRRREGAFMGIWSFLDKAAIGLAIFVGMQGLERVGYRPNVEQAPAVILGIKVLYCLVPAACHVAALLLFRRFPMTAERHAQIRAQLDARAAAAGG
jgi:GPH family glycoside/pentoside/hexuronide:cation symporter